MFFVPDLLTKRGALFHVWIAATQQGNALKKYLPPRKVREQRIDLTVEEILKAFVQSYPSVPRSRLTHFSLYLSAKLLYGCCVVIHKQASLLEHDICEVFKNIKLARWSKEKQALVFKSAKKAKPKSDQNGANTQSAVDDDVEEETINGVVISELDISYFDHNEGAELIFPNSVPNASITLIEDFDNTSSHLVEDMRFGDEDVERHPAYLLPTEELYGGISTAINEDLEMVPFVSQREKGMHDLLHEKIMVMKSSVDQTLEQRAEERNITILTLLHESADNMPPPQSSVDQTLEQRAEERNITQTLEQRAEERNITQTLEQRAEERNITIPTLLHESADNMPPPHEEFNPDLSRLISDSGLINQDNDQIQQQVTHPHVPADEPLQLPELPPTPKPARKRRRRLLAIDEITEIPAPEMHYRIRTGAQDTLREREVNRIVCNEIVLSRPGRMLSDSLRYLVERNFRTRPMPTIDPPTTQPPGHSYATQNLPENNDLNLAAHGSRKRRAVKNLDAADGIQAKSSKPAEGVQKQKDQDHGLCHSPLRQSAQHDADTQADVTHLHDIDAEVEVDQTRQEDQHLGLFDSPLRQGAQLNTDTQEDVTHLLDNDAQVEVDQTRQKDQHPGLYSSPLRQVAQLNADTQEDVTHLRNNDAQVEVDQTTRKDQHLGLYSSPLRPSAQHETDALEDLPDRELGIPELRDSPSSPRLSIVGEGVLSEISTKTNMENGAVTSFEELCPPGISKKREAAKKFAALLQLQVGKRVQLTQHLDGVTIPPLHIKKLNGP
ncbi:Meiotic recombination protein REC8-like protein [Frankliniella fusca]|uniref:Meiotic recombination protein REC8-like protein n=1 Tax=Frankliniella fusca TaxID=407009 RepID=A0AAE1LG09_9NEOP|nr:Meiotic recombination protein REC8-like protein [Frankliniella fusca]